MTPVFRVLHSSLLNPNCSPWEFQKKFAHAFSWPLIDGVPFFGCCFFCSRVDLSPVPQDLLTATSSSFLQPGDFHSVVRSKVAYIPFIQQSAVLFLPIFLIYFSTPSLHFQPGRSSLYVELLHKMGIPVDCFSCSFSFKTPF